jgi:putative ABC transport system ATP-binding protein
VSTQLELDGVVVRYPGSGEVLRGIDLEVQQGELVGIVGPSGAGKSTLLNVMGTLERPSAGAVRIAGRDASRLPDAELSELRACFIGFVFQQAFLLDGVSVLDNVAAALIYRGVRPGERRRAAADALERVELSHRLHAAPATLSAGERARCAIARAVVGRPAVVLADEPTGNLDSRTTAEIVALVRELNDGGATIVVVTHDHEVAAAMRRRVEIRDGRIAAGAVGSPERE